MTSKHFRKAVGLHRSRELATQCGYTPENWRMQVSNDADIPPERLACMLNALEALNKSEAAFIRAARKEIEVKP